MYRVTEYILDDRVSGLTIWTGKSGTFISFIAKPKDFPGKPSVLCYKKSKQKENRTEGNKGTQTSVISGV